MIFALINLSVSSLILLFFWVFAGSVGLPGGTLTMIAFGSLAENVSTLVIVIMLSFIAAVLGDILAYELARKLSNKLRNKLRNFFFFKDNEQKTKKLLNKYGFPIIFFTRFIIINLCVVVSYVSGLERISRKKFVLAVISGELLFAVIYPLIGFAVGEVFSNLLTAINDIIIAVLLLVLVFYLTKVVICEKHKKPKS